MLAVRVAVESLKESLQEAFAQEAQALGQSIAANLVYGESIGAAMKKATAAALEQISAQAMVKAIFSLAEGFAMLAVGDFGGAAHEFEAAALYGAVGVAAGVAGRAVAGSQGGSGASAGGGTGGGGGARGGGSGGDVSAPYGTAATGGKHITVHIYGNYYGNGIQQVASDLNDAVLNLGVTLTSTNTKTGVVVQR